MLREEQTLDTVRLFQKLYLSLQLTGIENSLPIMGKLNEAWALFNDQIQKQIFLDSPLNEKIETAKAEVTREVSDLKVKIDKEAFEQKLEQLYKQRAAEKNAKEVAKINEEIKNLIAEKK